MHLSFVCAFGVISNNILLLNTPDLQGFKIEIEGADDFLLATIWNEFTRVLIRECLKLYTNSRVHDVFSTIYWEYIHRREITNHFLRVVKCIDLRSEINSINILSLPDSFSYHFLMEFLPQ